MAKRELEKKHKLDYRDMVYMKGLDIRNKAVENAEEARILARKKAGESAKILKLSINK